MGKLVEKKRKKKKGRPSLLDLQKRTLKLQKHLLNKHNKNLLLSKNNINNNNNKISNNNNNNNNNDDDDDGNCVPKLQQRNPNRRSTRRNPQPVSDDGGGGSAEDYALVNAVENVDEGKSVRKRKIGSISRGSGVAVAVIDDNLQVEKQSIAATKETKIEEGTVEQDDRTTTPLPDKNLLLFILDSLRKKDTHEVFAEPVDPEELPDYHDIIKHPMDFSTVQKKLENDAYGNLEQFEKDIYLICSNAMEYNSPDTIYFRQARSIHELARKHFESVRQDSDEHEIEPESKVVRRGRPPKHLKRPRGRPPLERSKSDFSEATVATVEKSTNRLNEHTKDPPLRKKHGSTDSLANSLCGSRNSDTYVGQSTERSKRSDDMLGSISKGFPMKHWKKQNVLDDSRRSTYWNSDELSCRHESSVLTTFHRERKQLVGVGLHAKYGYARSLARFAAKLGPAAWKLASIKIGRCLPSDIKFGQGWVGENDSPSERVQQQSPDASVQSSGKPHTEQSSEMHMPGDHLQSNNEQNTISNTGNDRILVSVSSPSMHGNSSGTTLINKTNDC